MDLGQAVIHEWLSLSILFETNGDDKAMIKDLLFKATEMGMRLEFQVFDEKRLKSTHLISKSYRYAVTLIAEQISASALHEVTSALARVGININVIERLSEAEFSCVEMLVSSAENIDRKKLKKELLTIALKNGVDIALQAEGLYRRAKRLVVFDMDSTLIQNEVIDEFARECGVYDEVAAITHRAMNGEMKFNESLALRCAKLKGLTTSQIDQVYERIEVTPGAEDLIRVLKKLGYTVAIISGGFSCIAERLRARLGIDLAFSNQLEMVNGVATGGVIPPIVNAERKAELLLEIAKNQHIHPDQVIAIGDGANDIPMLEQAGLGIAFNAKKAVQRKADLALSQKNLRSILYLLGISGRDLTEVLS